jgi:hypothetical protein
MFNLTADYYKKELTDLLGTVPTPYYSTPFNGSFFANSLSMGGIRGGRTFVNRSIGNWGAVRFKRKWKLYNDKK